MGFLVLETWVVFQHRHGSTAVPLAGDRKSRVLAVGGAVIGVAFARDRGELGAHAGRTGVVAIGGEVVGDCCGRAVILVVAVVFEMVVEVAAAAEIGGGSWTSETGLEVQLRVW
jgi:hypothetical protein